MNYEQLQKANSTINPVDIKGKKYAEVSQRIKAFRMCFPEGFIRTQIISNENGVCLMRAEVGFYIACDPKNGEVVLGTGTASESQSSGPINKFSHIENCETSAVGRALGMAGFGVDVAVASAEEVTNAEAQKDAASVVQAQEDAEKMKITETMAEALLKRIKDDKVDIVKLLRLHKVDILSDLTMRQFRSLNDNWEKVKASCPEVNAAEEELFA